MVVFTTLSLSALLTLVSAAPTTLNKRAFTADTIGCYPSSAVSGYETTSNSMTLEKCSATCATYKTTYFAVTGGNTCDCSNYVFGVPYAFGCYSGCSGNSNQACGGWLAQNVYTVDYSSTTTTTSSAKTSSTATTSSKPTMTAPTTTTAVVPTTSTTSTTSAKAATSTTSTTPAATTAPVTPTSTTTSTTAKATSTTVVVPTTTSVATISIPSTTSQASTTSPSSTTAAATSTSSPSTTTAMAPPAPTVPVQTAVPAAGFTLQQSGLSAAANGQNFRGAYIIPDGTYNVAMCAGTCLQDSGCVFFNIYQQTLTDGSFQEICVSWGSVQSTADFNNYWNNGLAVSYSAGYVLNTVLAAASATSTTASILPTATAGAGDCSSAVTPAGYTPSFSCLTAAADGAGYLSSYVDTAATNYATLLTDCAASCDGNAACMTFNVYQEYAGATNICVLWSQVKDASTATNTYNNGIPVLNSNAYNKGSSSSTTTSAASTATATSCAGLAPGYATCKNGQMVVNGACVSAST